MSYQYNQPFEHVNMEALVAGTKDNGVISGLAVTERGAGQNQSVDVTLGTCGVDNVTYTESGTTNVPLDAAHGTLARKDLIYYDTSGGTPAQVAGTAGASPVPPDIPAGDILLGIVNRSANDNTIANTDIVDGRVYMNSKINGIEAGADVTGDHTPGAHAPLHLRDGGDEIIYYSPTGSTVLLHDTTEDGTTSTSYVKLVERTITSNAYTLIVTFELKSSYNGSAGAAYAAIYKNGVLFGTEQGNSTTSWSTKSQTLGDWANNDKIQIYAKSAGSGATASIKNMKVVGTMLKFPVQPTWT